MLNECFQQKKKKTRGTLRHLDVLIWPFLLENNLNKIRKISVRVTSVTSTAVLVIFSLMPVCSCFIHCIF